MIARRVRSMQRCALALVAAVLVACGGGPPKPAQVEGSVKASPQVNPSVSRRPSPILVRVYELKSANAFSGADFMSLYQRDSAELGGDLLAKEEFVLAPGETKPYVKTLAPDTKFLGIVGAYRDVEHARWRQVVPIKPSQKHQVTIEAGALAIDVKIAP